jgi:type II secretory ATPase GspE/PulE/Tfp pilus assembly ATPase PilB-like protein
MADDTGFDDLGPITEGKTGNLGEILLRNSVVTNEQLEDARDQSRRDGSGLTGALARGPGRPLVNLILVDAIKRGASDIHIEPYEKSSASATASTACSTRS